MICVYYTLKDKKLWLRTQWASLVVQTIKNLPTVRKNPKSETHIQFQFSHSVMSDSLQHHGLQHARPPCPPTPKVYSNSCPLSRWCHPTISSSAVPFSSHLQSFLASGFFPNESALCIRWPKYWSFSFSISPSNDYSVRISFRMDWLDLLACSNLGLTKLKLYWL